MATGVQFGVQVIGDKQLRRKLKALSPRENRRVLREALLRVAFETQTNAARKQILPGGKGPPHPTRLTSRTGSLRRSIAVSRRGLPREIEVGTHLIYGAVHELGTNRYPKRPFLRPAADEIGPKFPEYAIQAMQKAVRKA